jgi:hypothetical protein
MTLLHKVVLVLVGACLVVANFHRVEGLLPVLTTTRDSATYSAGHSPAGGTGIQPAGRFGSSSNTSSAGRILIQKP